MLETITNKTLFNNCLANLNCLTFDKFDILNCHLLADINTNIILNL